MLLTITEECFSDLRYLFCFAVAHPELMEPWEESRSDSQNLGVELRGPGHGRGPRQKNHSLG